MKVPAFDVPANKNREICVFAPIPAKDVMNIGEVRIVNIGGKTSFATHHLIVYAYHGNLADVKAGEVKDDATRNFIKQQLEAFAKFVARHGGSA